MSSNHSTHPRSRYLQELERRVIIFDGAMGTNIQNYHLEAADYGGERTEGCNEYLVITRPDVIEEIHSGFMQAGSDVLETDTFTGSRLKLDEYGLGHLTHEVNFTAARLARDLADRYSTPQSEAMHVVERYRFIDVESAKERMIFHERRVGRGPGAPGTGPYDPKVDKALQLTYTVEDPVYLTMPYSAQITYRRTVVPWSEQVCAENIVEYWPGMNIAVPKADRPDF